MFGGPPLSSGDRLLLFLERYEVQRSEALAEKLTGCSLVSGSVLSASRSCVVVHANNESGPDVVSIPNDEGLAKMPTVTEFRERVRSSVRRAVEFHRTIEADHAELDVPRLLAILGERNATDVSIGNRDYFTTRICTRLAERQEPEVLSRAREIAPYVDGVQGLCGGFATTAAESFVREDRR